MLVLGDFMRCLNYKNKDLKFFTITSLLGGKSAILTAIIVGLGGKANITSRGNSLRGFIKEGCRY